MADVPIPADSIIQSTVTFVYGEAFCQYKWYFRTTAPFEFLANLCSYIMNVLVIERLMTKMVAGVRLMSVSCALVSAEIFTEQTLFPHDPTYGALPELGAAPIVCNVWQLRTGTAGRRGRGRMLIFGFPNAYIENYRNLSDFAYSQLRALADSWEQELSGNGSHPYMVQGVFSRKKYEQTGDPGTSFAQLQYINTHKRLSSRSSRRS